jgi:hypothetical protein
MTDPNPVVDALLASGRRELTTTSTEDTAVIDAETPVDPIPADDQPHAYVVVQRTHSVNADRPEWAAAAYVISEHDHDEIAFARARGRTLLPIGPDGDTGTRAIVEPRRTEDPAELDTLPIMSIVRAYGVAHQAVPSERGGALEWLKPAGQRTYTSAELLAACRGKGVTVLYEPVDEDEGADRG